MRKKNKKPQAMDIYDEQEYEIVINDLLKYKHLTLEILLEKTRLMPSLRTESMLMEK